MCCTGGRTASPGDEREAYGSPLDVSCFVYSCNALPGEACSWARRRRRSDPPWHAARHARWCGRVAVARRRRLRREIEADNALTRWGTAETADLTVEQVVTRVLAVARPDWAIG